MSFASVLTDGAPRPIGPYQQALVAGGFLFVSGQIALHPQTGELIAGDVQAQTRRVLESLGAILEAGGATFGDIVKTTIFLADINDFAAVNAVYGEHVGQQPPARSAVGVAALPRGALVEIEAIAYIG